MAQHVKSNGNLLNTAAFPTLQQLAHLFSAFSVIPLKSENHVAFSQTQMLSLVQITVKLHITCPTVISVTGAIRNLNSVHYNTD